jgi:hypothetical protein
LYVDSIFDWLEGLGSGFSRHDKDTWKEPYMPAMFNGILNYLEIPHQDFVWRVRTNPKVLEVGSTLAQRGCLIPSTIVRCLVC